MLRFCLQTISLWKGNNILYIFGVYRKHVALEKINSQGYASIGHQSFDDDEASTWLKKGIHYVNNRPLQYESKVRLGRGVS